MPVARMPRRDHSVSQRQEFEPWPLGRQSFSAMQEQQRAPQTAGVVPAIDTALVVSLLSIFETKTADASSQRRP